MLFPISAGGVVFDLEHPFELVLDRMLGIAEQAIASGKSFLGTRVENMKEHTLKESACGLFPEGVRSWTVGNEELGELRDVLDVVRPRADREGGVVPGEVRLVAAGIEEKDARAVLVSVAGGGSGELAFDV